MGKKVFIGVGHGGSDPGAVKNGFKEKDLNPVWNESFYFNISDPSMLHFHTLEAYVYNNIRPHLRLNMRTPAEVHDSYSCPA